MILLIGPSASGKTAIGKALEQKYGMKKVVTYTTREKRINEIDNIDYHFISKDEFQKKVDEHFFYETIEYNLKYYGTSKESLNDNSYLIVDPNGLKSYQNSDLFTVSFFLDCDKATRIKRMKEREDSLEDVQKRIEVDAKTFSISQVSSADYFVDVTKDSIEMIAKKIYLVYQGEALKR